MPADGAHRMLLVMPGSLPPQIVKTYGSVTWQCTAVMTYTGSWNIVGTAGINGGTALYVSLAFNPTTAQPYVAFQDGGHTGKATVMRYDSSWVAVGSAGFSTGAITHMSLAFSPGTSQPSVAFVDMGTGSGEPWAYQFDGSSSWTATGSVAVATTASNTMTALAFNPNTSQPVRVGATLFPWRLWALPLPTPDPSSISLLPHPTSHRLHHCTTRHVQFVAYSEGGHKITVKRGI